MKISSTKHIAALAAVAAMATTTAFAADKPFTATLVPVNDTPEGAGIVHIRTKEGDNTLQSTWRLQATKKAGDLAVTTITGETIAHKGATTTIVRSSGTVDGSSIKNYAITSYEIDGKKVDVTKEAPAPDIVKEWGKVIEDGAHRAIASTTAVSLYLKMNSSAGAAGFCMPDGTGHAGYKKGNDAMQLTVKGQDVTVASNTWGNTTFPAAAIPASLAAPQREMLSTTLKAIPSDCAPK